MSKMVENSHSMLGWIGLGSMGIGMATNLQNYLKANNLSNLKYYNRTASKGAQLQASGGVHCQSIKDLATTCDIIFISTSNDAALEGIVGEIIASGDVSSKIIVDTTTVHPNTSKAMSEQCKKTNATFIAAPAFGASPLAESGQLLIAVAGPAAALDTISPYLQDVMARAVLRVSEQPEKATLLKTCGNFMIAGIMEVVAEALVLAEKSGFGTSVLEQLIEHNFGALAYSDSKRMTDGVYMPRKSQLPYSDLNLAIKDVGHGISCAQSVGTRLPTGEIVMEHLQRAKKFSTQHEDRPLDSSSMYGILRQDAGLDFASDFVRQRDEK